MADAGVGGLPSVPLQPLLSRDPQQLGEFRLLGRLGSGGMGTAFLGQGPSGWVVVKEAHASTGADPAIRARMHREVAAMRQAAGPYTAAVVDADLDGEVPWVAMEFVPGETLARTIEGGTPLSGDEVEALARGVAAGLAFLHGCGVVHRDLKPSNIMLSPSGPRLIDLGIAEVEEGTQLTRTGSIMGSTGWLAPEQIRGDDVGPATDVHAWALCVIYAATGTPPFGADASAAAIYRVLETTPQIPTSIREPLRGLLNQALNKDPSLRPMLDHINAKLITSDSEGEDLDRRKIAKLPETPGNEARTERRRVEHASSRKRTQPHVKRVVTKPDVPVSIGKDANSKEPRYRRHTLSELSKSWSQKIAVGSVFFIGALIIATLIISLGTHDSNTTISVGKEPKKIALSPDGKRAFVTNSSSNTVSVIDISTSTVIDTIPVGGRPGAIAISPLGLRAYVANSSSNTVSVIDIRKSTVIDTIPVGEWPWSIAVSPNGRIIYVANVEGNSISVIDTAKSAAVSTVPVGMGPRDIKLLAVSPNEFRAYVVNWLSDSISVIDLVNNTVIDTIPVGEQPWAAEGSLDGRRLYVTNSGSNSVSLIDATTSTVTSTIPVGKMPQRIAVLSERDLVYVTNRDSNSLSVINAKTSRVIDTIPIGAAPWYIDMAPDERRVYVANWTSNSVSVIDTITSELTQTISVGKNPSSIKVSSDGHRVYVTNSSSASVSVINTRS